VGTRVLIVLALVASLAACKRQSALYCQRNGSDYAHCPMPDVALSPDGFLACTDDMMCPMARPHCAQNNCVECTGPNDCPSAICLFGGTCQSPDDTSFVVETSTSTTGACTMADPCPTIEEALLIPKPNIKLTGNFVDAKKITLARDVNIFADPATQTTFTLSANGDVFTVMPGFVVNISAIEIICLGGAGVKLPMPAALGLSQVKIHGCMTNGVLVMNGGSVTISQSRIYGNTKSGVFLGGAVAFDITNSMITGNGASNLDAAAGGVVLGTDASVTNRFAFNTVADNKVKTMANEVGGIACPAAFAINNNLLANNLGGTVVMNASAGCIAAGSRQASDDSDFVNPAGNDYHLVAGSQAIDKLAADPMITQDIDGEVRPKNTLADYGADEH
jgi:hypothetical protein